MYWVNFVKKLILTSELGRKMYIAEAALEYLISLLVSGSFLAILTKQLGFSDSLTGILSSVISLGCLFQLISVTLKRKRVKSIVITLSIINQLLFMLLYIIPLLECNKQIKIALFVVIIVLAYIIYNFAHPKKINWMMSLVDDNKRGMFTANKEIISLISGMVFSFIMGAVTDHFSNRGRTITALIIAAAVIFAIMLCHTISMLLTVEKELPSTTNKTFREEFGTVFKDKKIIRVALVSMLYYISYYASTPFYGAYKIGDLGFSLKLVSALVICTSISRVLFSKFWGRYADKKSFAIMIEKCLLVMLVSMVFMMFAVPSNGKVMVAIYCVLSGIAMGGTNSALTNMVFDYAPYEKRSNCLAVCQAISGVVGFLTTICVSPIVSYIQKNGNSIWGFNVYAPQVVTAISICFMIITILYVRIVLINKKR